MDAGGGGRLKSDYRYSKDIVYNNFPWPDGMGNEAIEGIKAAASSLKSLKSLSPAAAITTTAQGILDARAAHPDCTLADLYAPLTMPLALRAAHKANDRAVLEAYGLVNGRDARSPSESEIVAHLFNLCGAGEGINREQAVA